ncbi:GCN5-related N-acetyltransferase [Candidatus Magnetomoraceae bacterium gMMP-13]
MLSIMLRCKMPEDRIILKSVSEHDLENILRIQNRSYKPYFYETIDVFKEKIKFFPNGCWLVLYNKIYAGYLFSHPWRHDSPIELNSPLGTVPNDSDCLYIHDVAVAPKYQRKGIGNRLFVKAKEITEQLKYKLIVAVSVQNSAYFWGKLGFQPFENMPNDIKTKLLSYGKNSSYMILDLSKY